MKQIFKRKLIVVCIILVLLGLSGCNSEKEELQVYGGDFNQMVEEIQNSVPYKNIEEMIEDICIQFGYELKNYEGMERALMDIAWKLFNKKKMVLMVAGKYKSIY